MLILILSLIIVFLISALGLYYYSTKNATQTSTPVYTLPPVTTPTYTPDPAPVTTPEPTPVKTRLATVDGKDFLCPQGYYYEGDATQQACVKEGVSGYVCPSGWSKINGKPYCQFSPDVTGNDGASAGDTSSSTTSGGGQPTAPINNDSSTTVATATPTTEPEPVVVTAPTPVPTYDVTKVGLCPFGRCNLVDANGNCRTSAKGGYHCYMTDLHPFDYNGKKHFGTSDAIKNTDVFTKMCYATKKHGKYVCKFEVGNTFIMPDGSKFLNVFPEDNANPPTGKYPPMSVPW